MNRRIKELRKSLDLTLSEFGKRLGVGASTVNQWERGMNGIPRSRVQMVCAEFNVNRDWLETGRGEMFVQGKTKEILDYEAFSRVVFKIYAALPRELRAVVVDVARDIVGLPPAAPVKTAAEKEPIQQ